MFSTPTGYGYFDSRKKWRKVYCRRFRTAERGMLRSRKWHSEHPEKRDKNDYRTPFERFIQKKGFKPSGAAHGQWSTYNCTSRVWYKKGYGFIRLEMSNHIIVLIDSHRGFFGSVPVDNFDNYFLWQTQQRKP